MPKELDIVRPKLFPECATCPVAEKIIEDWQNFDPVLPYESKRPVSISISCVANGPNVLMTEESIVMVKFRKDRKTIPIERGNRIPYRVACPHFGSIKPPESEPE